MISSKHLFTSCAISFVVILTLSAQNSGKAYLEPAHEQGAEWETTKTNSNGRDPKDILRLYPDTEMIPRLSQYKWRPRAWKIPTRPQPAFVALLFADLHSESSELKRIMTFYNYYEEYFDAVLSAGDALHHWDLDYSFWKEAGASKVLPVLGNHEVFAAFHPERKVDEVALKKWKSPSFSQKEAYERFYKPYLEETKFTNIPEGKCYWYKDFPDLNIRLFGMDSFHWREKVILDNDSRVREYPDGEPTDNGEQQAWFRKALEDARTKHLSVICMDHCPYRKDFEVIDCPFTSIYRPGECAMMHPEMILAVDEFIANGGDFVTWLCGHVHYDLFSIINAPHSRQLQIAVDKSTPTDGTQRKFKGTVSEDCFDIIAVDPNFGILTLQRIGAEYDPFGRHIGTMVYDYRNKSIISHD